jgi:hypothetical protein
MVYDGVSTNVYDRYSLTDRQTTDLDIGATEIGEYRLDVKLERYGKKFEKSYYFYTKSPNENFLWYPTVDNVTINPVLSCQYGYQQRPHGEESFIRTIQGTDVNTLIKKSIQDPTDTTHVLDYPKVNNADFLIAFSLNFSRINEISNPILTFKGIKGDTTVNLSIYQDHIEYDGINVAKIYIPKDEYHLITIYKRACYYSGGNT